MIKQEVNFMIYQIKIITTLFFLLQIYAFSETTNLNGNKEYGNGNNFKEPSPTTSSKMLEPPFYLLGKDAGYNASKDEIIEKNKLLKIISPNNEFKKNEIEMMIIADKYIESICKIKPSDGELYEAYNSYCSHLDSNIAIPFHQLSPLLQINFLISNPENKKVIASKIKEYNEKEQLSIKEKSKDNPSSELPDSLSYMEMNKWPTEELQIRGYNDDCIAYTIADGECILSLEEFNKNCLTFQPSKKIPLDSARLLVLDKSLNILYLSGEAKKNGFAALPEVQNRIKSLADMNFEPRKNKDEVNDQNLKKLYDKYYDTLFAEKEIVLLDLIGSTDSSYIDSIHTFLNNNTAKTQRRLANRKKNKKPPKLPWISSPMEKLPKTLTLPTDTLYENEFTKPIKTNYGFFILKIAQIENKKEIPFEEVRSHLIHMIDKGESTLRPNEITDSEARNYYKHFKKHYRKPDTLHLKAWLVPTTSKLNEKRLGKNEIENQTNWQPMEITNLLLPIDLQKRLQRLISQKDSVEFLGPVETQYGTWYFSIKSIIKANGYISFRKVRKEIKSLLAHSSNSKSLSTLKPEKRKKLLTDEIIAQAYWRRLVSNTPQPKKEEVLKAIENGIITLPDFPADYPEEYKMLEAAELLKDKIWRKDLERWKSEIEETDLLYSNI